MGVQKWPAAARPWTVRVEGMTAAVQPRAPSRSAAASDPCDQTVEVSLESDDDDLVAFDRDEHHLADLAVSGFARSAEDLLPSRGFDQRVPPSTPRSFGASARWARARCLVTSNTVTPIPLTSRSEVLVVVGVT